MGRDYLPRRGASGPKGNERRTRKKGSTQKRPAPPLASASEGALGGARAGPSNYRNENPILWFASCQAYKEYVLRIPTLPSTPAARRSPPFALQLRQRGVLVTSPELSWVHQEQHPIDALGPRHQTTSGKEVP